MSRLMYLNGLGDLSPFMEGIVAALLAMFAALVLAVVVVVAVIVWRSYVIGPPLVLLGVLCLFIGHAIVSGMWNYPLTQRMLGVITGACVVGSAAYLLLHHLTHRISERDTND